MIQRLLKGVMILALPMIISCGSNDASQPDSNDIDSVQDSGMDHMNADAKTDPATTDPVCGMERDAAWTDLTVHNGDTIKFCSEGCKMAFEARPEKYLTKK